MALSPHRGDRPQLSIRVSPQIEISWPEIVLAKGEARKTIGPARSSGSPRRPRGTRAAIRGAAVARDGAVVAAVHAGRVGARIGIVPAVIDTMRELGARPERIGAFLGPAACGRQYEVPAAMQRDVEEHLPGSACLTDKRTPGLDLRAGLRRQLLALGVAAVAEDPRCTIEDAHLFSHRRGAPTGRLASVIWIDPSPES